MGNCSYPRVPLGLLLHGRDAARLSSTLTSANSVESRLRPEGSSPKSRATKHGQASIAARRDPWHAGDRVSMATRGCLAVALGLMGDQAEPSARNSGLLWDR